MKTWSFAVATAVMASGAIAKAPCVPYLPVTSEKLQNATKLENLVAHEQAWEDFAFATPARNRYIGSKAHNQTIEYIVAQLNALGDYYTIEKQPFFTDMVINSTGTVTVNGDLKVGNAFDNTKNGSFTGLPLIWINSYGCNSSADWPATVRGGIGLVSRGPSGGNCTFSKKSVNAGLAGAVALVVYDNVQETGFTGTLGTSDNRTIPSILIQNKDGLALVERVKSGEQLTADFFVETIVGPVYTGENVIATSTRGDPDNIIFLGAHSDSVEAGPGINDNGSGSAAILELAIRLSRYLITNTVRFGWWTGEEEGLLGSEHYVETLPAEEAIKIRLYLNFDMIASGNGKLCRYDGDGSRFGTVGPAGSDQAEKLFADYFTSKNVPLTESEFDGRSDYGPFLDANVPCGGLDTGAEKLKTAEEAAIWGGQAGLAYDVNYHGPGDTLANMSLPFFEVNAKAMAHALATYATSFEGFPPRTPPEEARKVVPRAPKRPPGKKCFRGRCLEEE